MKNDIKDNNISNNGQTIYQIIDTMDHNQKKTLYYLIEKALQSKGKANTVEELLNMDVCDVCPYKDFFDKMKERINNMKT